MLLRRQGIVYKLSVYNFTLRKQIHLIGIPRYVWHGHGNYSLAGFEISLHRHRGRYILYNHMPSGLFVCVSWISFVVPIDAIPGRMALLVTLLLVMINMFNSSVEKEPLSQYITALSGKIL